MCIYLVSKRSLKKDYTNSTNLRSKLLAILRQIFRIYRGILKCLRILRFFADPLRVFCGTLWFRGTVVEYTDLQGYLVIWRYIIYLVRYMVRSMRVRNLKRYGWAQIVDIFMISISIILVIFVIFYPSRCVRYKKNKSRITDTILLLYKIMSYRDKDEKKTKQTIIVCNLLQIAVLRLTKSIVLRRT